MATPVRRTEPTPPPNIGQPAPVVAPTGWVITLLGAIGVLLASWTLYGKEAEGMWAGYHDQTLMVIVVLAALWMRSTLPSTPAIAAAGLCGLGLVLLGLFVSDGTWIVATEVGGGVVILLGTLLQLTSSD